MRKCTVIMIGLICGIGLTTSVWADEWVGDPGPGTRSSVQVIPASNGDPAAPDQTPPQMVAAAQAMNSVPAVEVTYIDPPSVVSPSSSSGVSPAPTAEGDATPAGSATGVPPGLESSSTGGQDALTSGGSFTANSFSTSSSGTDPAGDTGTQHLIDVMTAKQRPHLLNMLEAVRGELKDMEQQREHSEIGQFDEGTYEGLKEVETMYSDQLTNLETYAEDRAKELKKQYKWKTADEARKTADKIVREAEEAYAKLIKQLAGENPPGPVSILMGFLNKEQAYRDKIIIYNLNLFRP